MLDINDDIARRNTSRNIFAIVTQVIISGVVLFFLYRYLYDRLGVEQIGIWSLVTSMTSITRIGDLGLSAGVVKFVAQALGRRDTQRAADVVETVALTLGVLIAMLLVIGYPIFTLTLGYFLPMQGVPIALSILPYILISLWLMVIVSVLSGGLDGCLRMDLRGLFMGTSYVVYLGLAILLVPKYGLEGVVIAQLIQSVCLVITLWWILKIQLKHLPLIPCNWKFPVLKEMFGYGMNFQIISIINMLFDPIVKSLMSKIGGLEALGYYGMANTLILQGRAVIVEATRVIVPAIANLQEQASAKALQLFIISYRITFYVSVLFFGLLGISITTISILWLGYFQATFIQFALLLNLGWFANTLSVPAYFSNLGSGQLRANMINQAIVVLGSLSLGIVLGMSYGGVGVVIGTIISLIAGTTFLLISHIKQNNLHLSSFVIPKDITGLMLLSVFLVFLSNYGRDQQSSILGVIGIAIICSALLLLLGWLNPYRTMLLQSGKQ